MANTDVKRLFTFDGSLATETNFISMFGTDSASSNSYHSTDEKQISPDVSSASSNSGIPARLVRSASGDVPSVKRPYWKAAEDSEKYGHDVEAPWILSKNEVLDEIKWSLTTFVSKCIFTQTPNGTFSYNENCRIQGLSQGLLKSILQPILAHLSPRISLDEFTSNEQPLPVLKMIRGWVSNYMNQWKRTIKDLSCDGILQFTTSSKPLLDELKLVYDILRPVVSNPTKDYRLVDLFSTVCFRAAENAWRIYSWDDRKHVIVRELLWLSIQGPIYEITRWIDGHPLLKTSQNNNSISYLDAFIEVLDDENFSYALRATSNPIFARIASDLIAARKSVLILRRLVATNALLDNDHVGVNQMALMGIFSTVEQTANNSVTPFVNNLRTLFNEEIRKRCSSAKESLVLVLKEKLQLGKFLDEIKAIATTIGFDDVPYESHVSQEDTKIYLHRYVEKMNEKFGASGMIGYQWRFYLRHEQSEQNSNYVNLHCMIPWPLDLIVSKKHMVSYGKMFRFFLELECARSRLARLEFSYLTTASSAIGTQLSIQRFDLYVFLTKVMAIVSYEFCNTFNIANILDGSSIDEICRKHDETVDSLLTLVLSDDRSWAWAKLMEYLKNLSRNVETAWTNAHLRESDLAKYRTAFGSCKRFFDDLLAKKYRYAGFIEEIS